MANLADLQIGVGADTSGLRSDFDKVPSMAEEATDKVESKFEQMAPALKTAAKAAAVGAGAAIVAGAVIGMEREAAGDKLAAQLNLSESESKAAGRIAGGLYADAYGDSLGQVNEAVGAVVSTISDDLSDTSAIEGLSAKALDLAATFDQDVNESVATAGVLMKTGLAKDANEAFDLIAAGMQEMPAALRDELGEATTEYSKFFADLGFTGEETFALFAAADDKFALDKTGDALKELSIRATDMSTASVAAYEAAGLDAEVMADKILAGGDVAREGFDEIVDGLLSIENPTERANAAIGLFGTPLEDLGTAQIPDFLRSLQGMGDGLGDIEGRADQLGDTLNDNAQTKIAGFKRSVEGFLAGVVEAPGALGSMATGVAGLGAAAEPVAPMMTGVAVVFRDQLASMAGAVGRGATAVVTGSGRAIAAMGRWAAATAVQGAKAVGSMAVTAAKTVGHWLKMAAVSLAQAARMAASWVIAMGPVGWVIAAVVGLVALIIANWDTVVEWTRKAWEWVSDKVASAWRWVVDTTRNAVDSVVRFFTNLRDRAVSTVRGMWDSVVQFFRNLKADAIRLVGELVTGYVNLIIRLRDRVVSIFTGLRDRVVGTIDRLMDKVRGIKDTVLGFFSNAGRWLLEAGKNIIRGLIDGIKNMIPDVGGVMNSVVSSVRDRLPFSPAKKGPLSGRGAPDIAGAKIVTMMADGMGSQLGMLSRMGDRVGSAASPRVSAPRVPSMAGAPGGGSGGSGPSTVVLQVGDREFVGYMREQADVVVAGRDRRLLQEVAAGAGA